MNQREWSPWWRLKLQLFHLNCIIKTGREAREMAPPHLIKCECHARRSAMGHCIYGEPDALFTHIVLSLSLSLRLSNRFHGYLFIFTHCAYSYFSGLPLLCIYWDFCPLLHTPLSFLLSNISNKELERNIERI